MFFKNLFGEMTESAPSPPSPRKFFETGPADLWCVQIGSLPGGTGGARLDGAAPWERKRESKASEPYGRRSAAGGRCRLKAVERRRSLERVFRALSTAASFSKRERACKRHLPPADLFLLRRTLFFRQLFPQLVELFQSCLVFCPFG